MKRLDQKPHTSSAPPSLAFDRQTLRTLDQAALGNVAGGTTVALTAATIPLAAGALTAYAIYLLLE